MMAVCGTRRVLTGRPSTNTCCGCGNQFRQRHVHRLMGRAQDVDFINLNGINLRDGIFHFAGHRQKGKESIALGGRELLGIIQTFELVRQAGFRPARRQNGRRRHDRPGQRPAPRFVHARNARLFRESTTRRSNSKRSTGATRAIAFRWFAFALICQSKRRKKSVSIRVHSAFATCFGAASRG